MRSGGFSSLQTNTPDNLDNQGGTYYDLGGNTFISAGGGPPGGGHGPVPPTACIGAFVATRWRRG